jgi:cell volume regulation protein A
MGEIQQGFLIVGALLILGTLASRISMRLGVPALLLFLLLGMLAGSEGIGGIPFDDPLLAQNIGVVALVYILFAGGLETDVGSIRRVIRQGLSLSTLGVLFTAALVGAFSSVLLGISWLEGFLLGAIISSTDAAAVFSVLRTQSIGFKGDTRALLELESGSNDPMAVFLTMAALGLLTAPEISALSLLGKFVLEMVVGAGIGYALGRALVLFLNWLRLDTEGLYPVVTMASVMLIFSIASLLWGNGFLAVYVAGIALSGGEFIHKRSLSRFHDAMAWLMQMAMFLVLGLLVFPSRLVLVAGVGLAIAAFLMLVARPIAVMLSLSAARLRFRQKALISWVGLRGAVPIVLATFPYQAGYSRADDFFNVVFFAVLASVLLQGTTIAPVARWLRLAVPLPRKRQYPLEYVPAARSESDLREIPIQASSPWVGKRIMDLPLPASALVVLIGRGQDFLAPRGGTVLEDGDQMLVLARKHDFDALLASAAVSPPVSDSKSSDPPEI